MQNPEKEVKIMIRYRNVPAIEFDLEYDYKIKAEYVFDKELGKYIVTFYLRQSQVGMWDQIDKATDITFDSPCETIKTDIAKYFTKLLIKGFFQYYIDRYVYQMKCFDKGNDLYEKERLNAQQVRL